MTADYYPLQVLLLAFSGWVSRGQQRTIEYLVEENRVLEEQFKGRKLRLTDDPRRRLAAKGKQLGRRLLNRVATIVTPDTIMRWHRPAHLERPHQGLANSLCPKRFPAQRAV